MFFLNRTISTTNYNISAQKVNTNSGLYYEMCTWFWQSISPFTNLSIIELLPTPLSPRNTTLYFCCAILLLFNYEGFIIIIIIQMEDESFSIEALIFILILVIYILASYYINKLQISFLHESTVAIFLGFLTALFLKLVIHRRNRSWKSKSHFRTSYFSHYSCHPSYFQ